MDGALKHQRRWVTVTYGKDNQEESVWYGFFCHETGEVSGYSLFKDAARATASTPTERISGVASLGEILNYMMSGFKVEVPALCSLLIARESICKELSLI